MKSAQNQAGKATNTATDTGAGYGASAAGVDSNLVPFETQQLLHPMGYSPTDTSAQLASSLGGAGGATAGVVGMANQGAAQTGNASGFTAVLDDAARQKAKAAAGASEGIAAKNADVKIGQQNQAAGALGDIAHQDQQSQLQAMGQVAPDINANVDAGKSGWLQNTLAIMNTLNGAGGAVAGLKKAYG